MTPAEFNVLEDQILARLPPELRMPISQMAWESGHAFGYQEVLNHLENMVDILESPLRAYGERMKRS